MGRKSRSWIKLNNASYYRTNGLHRTHSPNPGPFWSVRPLARISGSFLNLPQGGDNTPDFRTTPLASFSDNSPTPNSSRGVLNVAFTVLSMKYDPSSWHSRPTQQAMLDESSQVKSIICLCYVCTISCFCISCCLLQLILRIKLFIIKCNWRSRKEGGHS